MRDFVDFLVGQIVDRDSYEIVLLDDGDRVDIKVLVDKDSVARLIGQGGRLAKSIRTVLKSSSQGMYRHSDVFIEER